MTKKLQTKHCFTQPEHAPHYWGVAGTDNEYWCMGQGFDEEGYVRPVPSHAAHDLTKERCREILGHQAHVWKEEDFLYWCSGEDEEAVQELKSTPEILDGRTAYGDKVQNQVEQAAMINAYLSGREVRPVDVPVIMILIKCHRLGKMPDYLDSYDDIEGYLSIAKSVIGPDMIEATTAKEYAEIKAAREGQSSLDQTDGQTMEAFIRQTLNVSRRIKEGSGNPYANVPEEDEESDEPDVFMKRCWIVSAHHEHLWTAKPFTYRCDGHGA